MAKKAGSVIAQVFKMIKDEGVRMIDFKFMDFPGQWQHFSVPVTQLKEDSFEEGFGFDGSSIRGWKPINESDMLIIPDPGTAFIEQFIEVKTLSLICDVLQGRNENEKDHDCPDCLESRPVRWMRQ